MAMAEVYRPESEDRLSPYPKAPPPSPEAQHRTLGGVFEFPREMLEGFGLDLRRRDFDFSENDDLASPIQEPTTVQRSSPKRVASSDTDDSDFEQPGSPMKRMCSAPSTMPNSFEVHGFQPSRSTTSSASVGNGSLLRPVSTGDVKVSIPNFSELAAAFTSHPHEHAHSHSTSPTLYPQQHQVTSPHSIPPRSNGSVTPTHQPTSEAHYDTSHLLSKSFDLHNVQTHFPANFEVTPPPPEVRPTRSRTLDTTSFADNPAPRMRKVSLKRNYDELESESNLQFPFDYSYSSTGSSAESDWVVIENDLLSCPQGKKACCQQEPLSSAAAAAMTKRRSGNLIGNPGNSLHHPQAAFPTTTTSNVMSFNNVSLRNTNGINRENMLLRSQEAAVPTTQQHTGQSPSLPLGVLSSNTGADLSSFPGGSAASNGSGSHSPLHAQLGMISETIGVSSSAELHNASSAGYNHMPTADAALAERSHRGEFVPQWSMELMDCGEYGTRLDSIDSMDCGMVNDAPATMQSISEEQQYSGGDLDNLFVSNYIGQPPHFQVAQLQNHTALQQYQQGLLNVGNIPRFVHGHTGGDTVMRTQSSEASTSTGGSHQTQKPTRHSLIENYFMSYHQSNGIAGGGTLTAGTIDTAEECGESRSSLSKSL